MMINDSLLDLKCTKCHCDFVGRPLRYEINLCPDCINMIRHLVLSFYPYSEPFFIDFLEANIIWLTHEFDFSSDSSREVCVAKYSKFLRDFVPF